MNLGKGFKKMFSIHDFKGDLYEKRDLGNRKP
jgi:hypothetical protein